MMEFNVTDDRIKGGLRKGVGRVQDALGALGDDAVLQARGKLSDASGFAQDRLGQAQERAAGVYDELEDFVKGQPLPAVAIALGFGVMFGLLMFSGHRR